MIILADIGEMGVHVSGKGGRQTYLLRPSLYAMSRLGEPREIISIYSCLMSDPQSDAESRLQFDSALLLMYACSGSNEAAHRLFGATELDGEYVPGLVPVEDILPLARSLIRHGVTGALPPLPVKAGENPEYVTEFIARDHVAIAMAHLSVTERDAWNMTMTSLVAALRSKYPPIDGVGSSGKSAKNEPPTLAEHDALMAWHDRVEAKRKKMQGVH